MKVAIPGGTGLIGKSLADLLARKGHVPVILTRNPQTVPPELGRHEIRRWDPELPGSGDVAFEGADAVVNLAGEPISSGRWTKARKKRIRDSRVIGTERIVQAITGLKCKPEVFIAGSAVGYYGSQGDEIVCENEPSGIGFAAEVCRNLEEKSANAAAQGVRVVQFRTGVVLSRNGGALAKMLPAFKLGLGGPLGNGGQWFPWIHEADMAGAILHILDTPALNGPVNATAPEPVTNREFTRALGRVLRRPTVLPVPALMLKLLFGEMSTILTASQRVVPQRLMQEGYRFRFEKLEPALHHLFCVGTA